MHTLHTLPDWALRFVTGAAIILTMIDLPLPDPIPFLDEATLFVLDYKLWREWRQRREESLERPTT